MELTSEAQESITLKVEVGARTSVGPTRPGILDTSAQSLSKRVFVPLVEPLRFN
jgi:hypothetical protein